MTTNEELRLEVNHLREINNIQAEASKQALQIQAKEYERRLTALNGEAERLREMQQTYVQKSVYEVEMQSAREARAELKEYQDKAEGRAQVISILISVGISISVGIIITVINLLVK